LLPAFDGKDLKRKAPIFWEHIGGRAVRDGKWKLVSLRGAPDDWELYDIEADRTEMNNVAAKHPQIVERMAAAWHVWSKRCNVVPQR
jgi:arylsulfatase A-like enzyme